MSNHAVFIWNGFSSKITANCFCPRRMTGLLLLYWRWDTHPCCWAWMSAAHRWREPLILCFRCMGHSTTRHGKSYEKESYFQCAQALGWDNHQNFCPRIATLTSTGCYPNQTWWWPGRSCAMLTAASAPLHYLLMTLAHIFHSVRGFLPSSSLLLRNSEEMRSDTWKSCSAMNLSGYKMASLDAGNSATWNTLALSSCCPAFPVQPRTQSCFQAALLCYALDFTPSLVAANWLCDVVRCLFLHSVVSCPTGHICQGKLQHV